MNKKYFQFSLTSLTFLLGITTCILFGWYSYLKYSIVPKYQKILSTMATQRTDEIDIFLNQQEKNAITLSQKSIIITALDNAYKKNEPYVSQKELDDFLSPYAELMLFKNILLIDSDGNIIFSTTKNNLVGTNINQNDLANSALSTSCERANMTFTNDFSYFSFNQLLQEPALFITIPILKDNKFIGTLAYQLNQEKIFRITNQYIGLGKTGEVTLGKREGSHVVFVSSTRHDPDLAFKKVNLLASPLSIQKGLLVKQGPLMGIDYRGKQVVGASTFIPKIDWGMIIKVDQDEILQPINFLYKFVIIFFIIFILFLLFNLYYMRTSLITLMRHMHLNKYYLNAHPSIIKSIFFMLLLLFIGLTIKNIYYNKNLTSSMIKSARDFAITTTSNNAEKIESILSKIAFVGQSIAQDLQSGHLIKEDISIRLKRDLKENNSIITITILFNPYTYDKTIQLYAPSMTKTDDHYQETLLTQSAINDQEETSIFKSAWYTQALEKGSAWLINTPKDEKAATASYSCVFLNQHNQPQGVIQITFSLAEIIRVSEYSGFGHTGYSIILSDNGTFIFHPITKMIQQQTTLLQFAQSQGNEELATIAQKVLNKQPALASYSSGSNHDFFTIYTQPIPINNWIIGAIFPEKEVSLAANITRHYYFWMLVWIIMSLLTLCALLVLYNVMTISQSIAFSNIIFVIALLCSWYIIHITTTINRESKTIITDQTSLNKFLNDLDEEANRKHESAPITIPFGLFLFSLNNQGADQLAISGYIWSKYNMALHKDISRSIDMPQATKIQFGKPLVSTTDNIETVTLNVQGTLFQEQNYAYYPFDQQQIRIIFEHRDIEKNIILTPDIAGYKKISPEETPGLNKEFTLAGFNIKQAFFEYHIIDPVANFGFKEYGKITDNYQLIYNVIMNRNLSNPFILYLLPLLVILFSLFCTLIMTGKRTDPFSILGPYTGLFFALVILHRSLREQLPTGTTLYMEYAFFYTYITIILLIIHTILTHYYAHWLSYRDTALHAIKLLFWPFQFITWLITTLIIFY